MGSSFVLAKMCTHFCQFVLGLSNEVNANGDNQNADDPGVSGTVSLLG